MGLWAPAPEWWSPDLSLWSRAWAPATPPTVVAAVERKDGVDITNHLLDLVDDGRDTLGARDEHPTDIATQPDVMQPDRVVQKRGL